MILFRVSTIFLEFVIKIDSSRVRIRFKASPIISIFLQLTDDLRQIQNALKQQKSKLFKQIKFVVHKPPANKMETLAIAQLAMVSCYVG